MRIAVPVEENEKEICPSFGRTPQFYIYDTETKEGTLIENEAMNAPGGAGIKAAQTVIDAKAEIVLVPRCGENAAKALVMYINSNVKEVKRCCPSTISFFESSPVRMILPIK